MSTYTFLLLLLLGYMNKFKFVILKALVMLKIKKGIGKIQRP
jgi:hypothetical protein